MMRNKSMKVFALCFALGMIVSGCGSVSETPRKPEAAPATEVRTEFTAKETAIENTTAEEITKETVPALSAKDFQTAHLNFMTGIMQTAQQECPKDNVCISAYAFLRNRRKFHDTN